MEIAREQGGADLPFKIIDAPANDVNGQFEPFRRGSETPATYYFQKNPGRVPIGETADCDPMVFLLRNAPFQRQTHTQPLPLGKFVRILGEPQPWRVQPPPIFTFFLSLPPQSPGNFPGPAPHPPPP